MKQHLFTLMLVTLSTGLHLRPAHQGAHHGAHEPEWKDLGLEHDTTPAHPYPYEQGHRSAPTYRSSSLIMRHFQ
jgi:hypothetical protein